MLVIGLTGSSGSGKSTVAAMLEKAGFSVIDCDQLARAVLRPDTSCLSDIFRTFGQTVKNADGTLNRRALGDIVFRDKAKLELLNGIMYPRITADIEQLLAEFRERGVRYAVLDAPTLFESGVDRLCDTTVSVLSEDSLRLERIMARDNITLEQAKSRLASQYPNAFYLERSDHTIENSESVTLLERQVQSLIEILQKKNHE